MVVRRLAAQGRAVALLTEARRALEVDHPCVVRVRSAEAAAAEILVASDYVDGEPYPSLLAAARENKRPLTLKLTLRIVCDVLAGLSAMHNGTGGPRYERIVFGRLTPDDLLVGADGLTRVDLAARQVRSESGIGYVAPEIALGGDADADERSDVYAVGVILWEALAEQRLYAEKTLDGLVAAQLRSGIPMPPLPTDAPWAEGVIAVVMRALAPDPGDRYVSTSAMLEALLEAAGRRVGTAGDVVELVESLVGPFVRARRREAQVPPEASSSDIRATSPDREDQTLRPLTDEVTLSKEGREDPTLRPDELGIRPLEEPDGDLETAVDFRPQGLQAPSLETDTETIPRLIPDDEADELKTEIQQDLLHALPSAEIHRTDRLPAVRPAAGAAPAPAPAPTRRRPTFAEDPSITAPVPPGVERELIAKDRQLRDDAPTLTAAVAMAQGILPLDPDHEDELKTTATDRSVPVNDARLAVQSSVAGAPAMRGRSDSIVTLDLPPKEPDASIVTARRFSPTLKSAVVAPHSDSAAREDVEELLAKTAALDRSAFPVGAPRILDETVNMDQGAGADAIRRAVAKVDTTLYMRKDAAGFPSPQGQMHTMPMAIPAQPLPQMSPTPAPVAMAPRPPFAPPPLFAPPPPPPPPRLTITEDEPPRSTALLGVFTFFLVLASLLVLAWLTFPYWRPWAGI